MVTFGGLNVKQLGAKLISMGCEGNSVYGNTLFCSSNQLGYVGFIKIEIDIQLEALLQALYGLFFHSPKKFLKYQSLCDVFTDKGNKQLKNIQTRWIHMLSFVKRVMEQYRLLIAKMHDMMF